MSKLIVTCLIVLFIVAVYGRPADDQCLCGEITGDFCSFRATDGTGYLKGCHKTGLYECKTKGATAVFLDDCSGYCVPGMNDRPGADTCH